VGEVLFWIAAVFTVLGVPPLILVWRELRRERTEAEERRRRRRSDQIHAEHEAPANRELGSPSSTSRWPGVFIVAWLL
jgi:hypothetical protein